MSELSARMLIIERRPCPTCPLVKKPGFFGRLVGLRPKTDTQFNYCRSQGPERLVLGGAVEVNYRTGQIQIERAEEIVCPVDLTPELRASSVSQEMLLYDRYEEAVAETEKRAKHPAELTVFEQQKISARSHFPPLRPDHN